MQSTDIQGKGKKSMYFRAMQVNTEDRERTWGGIHWGIWRSRRGNRPGMFVVW